MQRDGELLRSKISQLQSDEALWTNRARDVAHKDQDRALECVRRRKLCQKQLEQYQQAFIKHEALEQKLAQDIHAAERKLTEMSQQRNLMRTRQSAAEALNSICGVDESVALDVAEAFERWEVKVTESELEVGSVDSVDLLEREFLQTEDKKALQAELEELLAEKEVDHD